MTRQVKDPRLTLYAFHLRSGLSEGPSGVAENAEGLWEKCVDLGAPDNFNVPELRGLRPLLSCYECAPDTDACKYNPALEGQSQVKFLELLRGERTLKFTAFRETWPAPLKGVFYPLRMHDTYALDLTMHLNVEDSTPVHVAVDELSRLNPQALLLPWNVGTSLGQTLQLWVTPLGDPLGYEQLARDCVSALFKHTDREQPARIGSGTLMGSPIYEFDYDGSLTGLLAPNDQCHILVWFNSHERSVALAEETYHPLLTLLCCRRKILFAYHEARAGYQEARGLYGALETNLTHLEINLSASVDERLAQLKRALTDMPKTAFRYAHWLRNIQDHQVTIKTNIHNYKAMLGELSSRKPEGDNLRFLQNFLDDTCGMIENQIQIDVNYLNQGLGLFDRATSTLRGIVDIEQAEHDRSLGKTIQVIGVALAVGALVASSSPPTLFEKSLQWPFTSTIPHPFFFTFLLSLLAAVIAGWLTWLFTGRRNRAPVTRPEKPS